MQQWDFMHQSLRRALRADRPDEIKRLNEALMNHLIDVIENDTFAAREIMHHACEASRPDIASEVIARHSVGHSDAFARGLADVCSENSGGSFLLAIPAHAESVDAIERRRITKTIRE